MPVQYTAEEIAAAGIDPAVQTMAEPPPAEVQIAEPIATENPVATQPEQAKTELTKKSMETGGKLVAIVPRDINDAWRLAQAFFKAGMVPKSYEVEKNGVVQEEPTIARLMIGIMKGLEVGLAPVTALSTIMVVNNRPCLWGDGAKALVQASGKCEWIKERLEGEWGTTMIATCEAKRKDQSEPIIRTFSYEDAKRAGLIGKKGPWSAGYAPRMLTIRALSWVLRDGFADALNGLAIAEEVRDMEVEARRTQATDTSDLNPTTTEETAA